MDIKDFIYSLPAKVNPDTVAGLSTVFHFDISDAGQYTVTLDNGKIAVAEGLVGEAKCKVSTSAETLRKVLTKEMNPTMAVMMGKLKISNLSEMMTYAGKFGLM
jgi:putative sterol carrier protein